MVHCHPDRILYKWMPRTTEFIPAKIVYQDKDDVGSRADRSLGTLTYPKYWQNQQKRNLLLGERT
jgi:hypothetical protein